MLLENFIATVDAFCEEHDLSASQYGELAMNDRSFLHDLRAGKRKPRLDTLTRNEEFMANYKPKDAA